MKRIGILKYGAGVGLTTLALVAALAVGAFAYFSSHGTGNASAKAGVLSPSSISSSSAGAGTATINWSAVTPPSSGTVKYYVTRNGGAPAGNCPTAAAPSTVTTCTDSGLSKASYSYTVVAVWQSWTSTSAPASVSVATGAVSQLVVTTQPDGGATGGSAFPTQPVVKAEDVSGNVVTSYSGAVQLSIASGTTGATLSGCAGTLTNGVTAFTGCKIDKSGTYTLKAGDGTLSATSNSFTVSVGPASQLVFTTQPDGSPTGGKAFPTQPVLTAQDAGGNTVRSYAGTVSLAMGTNTTGGSLSGCTGTLANGITTFSGCAIDKAGTYTLTATDGTLNATSGNVTVAVGPAAKLVFTTQPAGGATGSAFVVQPKVTVEDAGGNTVATDSSTVALSITSGTPTAGGPGTLSGCTQTTSGGVVSFTGCAINAAGNGYQLHASDGSLMATDSSAFNVTTSAPTVSITFPANNTTYSGGTWTGNITGTAAGNGGTTVTTKVAIDDTTAGKWWDGSAFTSASQMYVASTGASTWSSPLAASSLSAGHSYTVTAQTTDSVGNVTTTNPPVTFTYSAAAASVTVIGQSAAKSGTINSLKTTNGATDLIVIYCWGGSSCGSTGATPTITGPFSTVAASPLVQSIVFSGNTKSCVEVVQATGNGTTGSMSVSFTGGSADSVGFVNVVELSSGATVKVTGSNPASQTQSTSAQATLGTPSGLSELAIVGLDGNSGSDTIAPPAGMTALTPLAGFTDPESSSSIGNAGGNLGMYYAPTAQSSSTFTLSPAAVDWGTVALGIG